MRLDAYLAQYFPEHSRSAWQKYIAAGKVRVNDEVITSNKYILDEDDQVTTDTYLPEDSPLNLPIIFENEDVIVVNKPVGVLSHAKGGIIPEQTVSDFFESHSKPENLADRSGVVHRLDRATSGIMIGAKTSEAAKYLLKQFSEHRVKKVYMAIVEGELNPKKAKIELPIERNPSHPSQFRVGANGKPSITVYEVVQTKNNKSLVKLMPETGRTHQLRVHMQQLKHPILGDPVYGKTKAKRMFLHANSLEITIPGGERKTFVAEVPEDFKQEMERES